MERGDAERRDDDRDRDREDGRERPGLFPRLLHLLPPGYAQELNLSEEQRKQVEKLESSFNAKRQAILMRSVLTLSGILQSLEGKEDQREPAPVLAIAHEVTGALLYMRRERAASEKKLLAILEPEQKQRYHALKERGPRDRDDRLGGRRDEGVRRAGFLSTETQQKLNLTPEQRKKLQELRKEFEGRARGILTTEQQQQLERAIGRPQREGSEREREQGRKERERD